MRHKKANQNKVNTASDGRKKRIHNQINERAKWWKWSEMRKNEPSNRIIKTLFIVPLYTWALIYVTNRKWQRIFIDSAVKMTDSSTTCEKNCFLFFRHDVYGCDSLYIFVCAHLTTLPATFIYFE